MHSEGNILEKANSRHIILKGIINATCPGHQEQVNLMLSKFPAIFTQWGITGCTISNSKI